MMTGQIGILYFLSYLDRSNIGRILATQPGLSNGDLTVYCQETLAPLVSSKISVFTGANSTVSARCDLIMSIRADYAARSARRRGFLVLCHVGTLLCLSFRSLDR